MFPNITRAAIVAAILATPALSAVLHEQLAAVPAGWTVAAIPDDKETISLTIGLTQQNIDQLESKLMAVSTPGNAAYGQHMEYDEVNALFAPSAAATSAVQSWLTGAGVTQSSLSKDGHWISFATTVGNANQMLGTTFKKYQSGGVQKLRTTQYSVPDEVSSYVDLISPTTFFGKTVAMHPTPRATRTRAVEATTPQLDASCSTSITPKCLKELYNVKTYKAAVKYGSRVGFGSFLNQSASYADLAQYEKFFDIRPQNFSVILIDGGVDDQNPATAQVGEANLDVQNIVGISHPLPVTEFITGGSPPFIEDLGTPTNTNEPYLPYYQYLLSKSNADIPQVISNSYGDDEQTVPKSYAVRVCNMIGMLGMRGISVLESSGDTGVGASCKTNDGKNTTRFNPQFPGTCPYIISVGGTQSVSPEIAWVAGSGGFSDYFPQPSYQTDAVNTYLANYITPSTKKYYSKYTNFAGRGFPDISAHSLTPDYQVVYTGQLSPSGGTSAAAPVVAAIIALLNDARFRAGKSSLGFINPLIYSMGAAALNDITGGQSVGCNGVNGQTGAAVPGGGIVPYATWNATVGWDPVTGLGTPNFDALKKVVLSM